MLTRDESVKIALDSAGFLTGSGDFVEGWLMLMGQKTIMK
jgi:hypothetical protein